MKRTILNAIGGLALLALAPVNAFAHAEVRVELGFPVYVDPPPVYYEPPAEHYEYYSSPPVYYGPRFHRDSDEDSSNRRHRGRAQHRHDRRDER